MEPAAEQPALPAVAAPAPPAEPQPAGPRPQEPTWPRYVAPLSVVVFAIWRLCPELGHPGIHDWDEAMHLSVARGLMQTPLTPHVYIEPLHPVPLGEWVNAGIWLHKPPGSMWLSALLMSIFGVSTFVARLPSVIAMTAVALSVYWLLRPRTGRVIAALAPMAMLSLPFTWELTQGYMFGDLTDTTLAGAVAVAVGLVVHAARTQSWRSALGAGAVVGYGYLCKSALALTPLGVALVLAVIPTTPGRQRLRFTRLLGMLALAAVVGLPWTIYSSRRWPELAAKEAAVVLDHLTVERARTNPSVSMWIRPPDAIFNEHHNSTLRPIPRALTLLAGVWLLLSALRRRDTAQLAVAAWLWASWLVLSYAAAKVPATIWGAVGASFFALGLLASDALKRPWLAGLVLGALSSDVVKGVFPRAWVEKLPPEYFGQTRSDPVLLDGLLLAAGGALALFLLSLPFRRRTTAFATLTGAVAGAFLFACAFPASFVAKEKLAAEKRAEGFPTHTRDAGLALAKVAPRRAVAWMTTERAGLRQFETMNGIFWSGRMVYHGAPDLQKARAHSLHAYLISPAAEPYEPIPVPAGAWLRVYDLEKPAPPAALPEGIIPMDVALGGQKVSGVGVSETPFKEDRWAFFVRPSGPPAPIEIAFHLDDGTSQSIRVEPEASFRSRASLANVPWFVLPTLGPKRSQVTAIELDRNGQRIPLG